MSSYSTTKITRSAARRAIIKKIYYISDDFLEKFIDKLYFHEVIRECQIVNDQEENEDYLLK